MQHWEQVGDIVKDSSISEVVSEQKIAFILSLSLTAIVLLILPPLVFGIRRQGRQTATTGTWSKDRTLAIRRLGSQGSGGFAHLLAVVVIVVEPPGTLLDTSAIVAATGQVVRRVSLVVLHNEGGMVDGNLGGSSDIGGGDVDVLAHIVERS